MADIKQLNFCAAGRRADPGVCVAWSVPLRSGIDARRDKDHGSSVVLASSGSAHVRCSASEPPPANAPIRMRMPPFQNRGDMILIISCCVDSSHAIMARRS